MTWHFDDGSRLQVTLNLGKNAQLVPSDELGTQAVETVQGWRTSLATGWDRGVAYGIASRPMRVVLRRASGVPDTRRARQRGI